ncbi:hypothetical protein [Halarsenatibacter silvermanii]|uniref:hypothetical protein n=1 Tax=Halarsenatibacter silvermanii TaxID=321763 RepID=UPI001F3B8C3A|nr:hypothetical protein [Halarsenatibacter silvermanii]
MYSLASSISSDISTSSAGTNIIIAINATAQRTPIPLPTLENLLDLKTKIAPRGGMNIFNKINITFTK